MKEIILSTLEEMLAPLFVLIVVATTLGGYYGGAFIGIGFVGAIVGFIQGIVVGALTVGVIYLLFDIRDSLGSIKHRLKKNESNSE